jgi:hypothetical protein
MQPRRTLTVAARIEIGVGIAVTAYGSDRLVEARGDALHFFEGTASVVRSQSRYRLKDRRQILSISFPRNIRNITRIVRRRCAAHTRRTSTEQARIYTNAEDFAGPGASVATAKDATATIFRA